MIAKEKIVLNEVMSGMKSQFYIPVFQRNYDWNIKNCERLFNDILDLTKDINKSHFIGSFVYKENKFIETRYFQFVLIDGQQRLTSITLMLKALYDYLATCSDKYEDLMIEISENYLFNKFAKDMTLRLKLKPNKKDDVNFNYLMDNDFEQIDKDSTIYKNYKYFLNRIHSMECTVEQFYNALQRLEGVVIALDQHDNAQLIFESLNSTGLDLSDVDLVRNYLLMNCEPEEQDRLYKEYWIKLEKNLNDNFINFLRDYLSLKNGVVTESGKHKVYETFKIFYTKNEFDLESLLIELLSYSNSYAMLLNYNKIENDITLKEALNDTITINMQTTYPFLLGVLVDYNNELIDSSTCTNILRLVESYSIRRSVCGVQGGALSMTMASLYKELYEKYKNELNDNMYEKVAKKMIGINTNAYFPKDDYFKDEFTHRDMYNSKYKKYILDKLECAFQSKEIVSLENLTVEHVMPNALNNTWKNYLNMDNVEEFHEQYKNRIGNLTLTAYNSEMSQKIFDEKKSHVDFSRLCLNKYFENITKWTKEEIEKRGLVLFEIAKKIWAYPNVTPDDDINTESHNILSEEDDYDYTNSKPVKFIYDEKEFRVNNWSDLYVIILRKLYYKNTQIFEDIVLNETFGGSRNLFGKDKSSMRSTSNISEDFFCEMNLNTMKKIKTLREIFTALGDDTSSIVVYIMQA